MSLESATTYLAVGFLVVSVATLLLLLRALGSIRRIEEVGSERLEMLREQRDRLELMYEERGLLLEMLETQKRLLESHAPSGSSSTPRSRGDEESFTMDARPEPVQPEPVLPTPAQRWFEKSRRLFGN